MLRTFWLHLVINILGLNENVKLILDAFTSLLHVIQGSVLRIQLKPIHQVFQHRHSLCILSADLGLGRENCFFQSRLVRSLLRQIGILGTVLLGIFNHAIDIILREPSLLGLDGRIGLGARYLVPCRNVEDAVRVKSERDIDLGLTGTGTFNARNNELSQLIIAHNGGLFTLIDDHVDIGLPVSDRRVRASFSTRNCGVALDQGRH
mmetsp:Transcript_31020/g.90740  ORF Transcript_31020/g.90740 Transcript_31020/m.90740 type:complete len:206 (-) Transcript_31020:857-1474(-)